MKASPPLRYAFTSFSCPQMTLSDLLSLAAATGYDGVELRVGYDHSHGVELGLSSGDVRQIREAIRRSGIDVPCIGIRTEFADETTAADEVLRASEVIRLAGALGVAIVRVFGGWIPDGESRAIARRRVEDALRRLAPIAGESNVTLALETHDDFCESALVADIVERVARPDLRALWDVMNPVFAAGESVDGAFEALRPWMCHVHVHDGVIGDDGVEILPTGKGAIDHAAAIRLLVGSGYDGFVAGEWIEWDPCELHLRREIATLREYESAARM